MKAVTDALQFNNERLQVFGAQLERKQASFDVALDTSAWDAAKDEIVPFLRRPNLQRRASYHFVRLAAVSALSRLYLDQVAGVASALGGVERTREALRVYLAGVCGELTAEGESLAKDLAAQRRGRAG